MGNKRSHPGLCPQAFGNVARRLGACLLCLLLLASALPFTAFADETEQNAWEHSDHTTDWTELTETGGMVSVPTGDGKYYLPDNASSLVGWTINYNVTLCLGENSLTVMDDLTIAEGASLTICTCQSGGLLELDISDAQIINNGSLTVAGGSIDGSWATSISIVNNGTLNLVGGTVTAASGQAAIQNNAGATLNMSGSPNISVNEETPSIVSAGTINATGYNGGNVKIYYTGDERGQVVTGTSKDNASKFINAITGETFATDNNGNLIAGEPVTYGSLLVAGKQVVDGAKYTVKANFDDNEYEPAYTVELTPMDDEDSTEYDFMWDETTHTLTLNSATIKATAVSYGSGEGAGQYALFTLNCEEKTGLNINLIGENTLTAVNSNVSSISSYPVRVIENLNGDITFTGSGSLTAQVVTDDYNGDTSEQPFATENMTAIYANGDVSNQTTLTVKGYEEDKNCITMTGVECDAFSNSGTFTAVIQDSANAQAINAASSFQNTGTVTIDIHGEIVSNNEKNDGGANGIGCASSFTNSGTIDIDISADTHVYGIYGTGEWLNEENAKIDISVNTGDSPTPVGGLTVGSGDGWTGPLAGISWKNDDNANTFSMVNYGTLQVSAESVKLATTVYLDWPTWQYCNTMGILISEGSFSSGSIENMGTMKLSALNGYTAGVYVSGADGDFRFENSGDLTIEATTMGGENARAVGIFEQVQIDDEQKIELPLTLNGGRVSITASPESGYENDVMEGGCMAICLSQAFTTADTAVSVDDLQQINLNGMSVSGENTALVLGPYEVGFFKKAYINTLGVGDTPATNVSILPTIPGAVTIQGTPQVGSTLTAQVTGLPEGVRVAYQWQAADSAEGPFTDITGATGQTYTPPSDNVGKYLRVVVTPQGEEYGGKLTAVTSNAISRPSTPGSITYPPTIEDGENGSVTITPSRPSSGQTVTIRPDPDEGFEVDEVIVTDQNGKEIDVTHNEDGSYSFTQPAGSVTITVTFRCDGGELCPSYHLTDITKGEWYHAAVDYVVKHGIMAGTSDTTFEPGTELTRAMAVQILYNLEGQPDISNENLGYPYADVNAQEWYGNAVYWARITGVAEGYGDGTFHPTDSITRQEFAQILYNYAAYKGYDLTAEGDLSTFPDANSIANWAETAMSWANGAGLINGHNNGLIDPTGTATRAQAASLLMKFDQNLVEK